MLGCVLLNSPLLGFRSCALGRRPLLQSSEGSWCTVFRKWKRLSVQGFSSCSHFALLAEVAHRWYSSYLADGRNMGVYRWLMLCKSTSR